VRSEFGCVLKVAAFCVGERGLKFLGMGRKLTKYPREKV